MGNTLGDIIKEVYTILVEDQTSTIFDKETKVIPHINRVILSVCKWEVINMLTDRAIRSWMLSFLHKEEIFEIPTAKYFAEQAIKDDTELKLEDVKGLWESGYLFIYWMFLHYVGVDLEENTVTLEQPLERDIPLQEKAVFAIQKPLKTIKYREIRDYERQRKLSFYDFQETPLYHDSYTVIPYEKFEYIVFTNFDGTVVIPSIIMPEVIEDTEEFCILPDNYGVEVIAPIVAWEELIDDGQITQGQLALKKGYTKLTEMYNFYASAIKERRKTIKVRPLTLDQTW